MLPHSSPTTDGADLFVASAQRIVDYLSQATPLGDWSVTRVAGGEQVHVHVHHDQLIDVGSRNLWEDSFCKRMVNGASPVAPDTLADPDYADLPYSQAVRSYAGVPQMDDRGEMFGVLCGFGTEPLEDADEVDLDLVNLMGSLLSSHLVTARTADRSRREAQIAAALAQTDALTTLTNRRGWDSLVRDAQQRVDAYGDPVAVAMIDLDGLKEVNDTQGHAAGDQLIKRAAQVIGQVAHGLKDRAARYGGDEFTVLANGVKGADLQEHFRQYVDALDDADIDASAGFAVAAPGRATLTDAMAQADRRMYQTKARRARSDDLKPMITPA